jgi:hypothetical protein
MTSKENLNENLHKTYPGIFGQVLNGYPLQCSAGYLLQVIVSNFNFLILKRLEMFPKY